LQPSPSMKTFPHSIEFLSEIVLRGPNVWTYCPALEVEVDIGTLEECPSNTLPGFAQRLQEWLPGLVEHRCSPGVRGGFLQRLHEGTWPAHILEHVSLELLGLVGVPAGFGRARDGDRRGVYRVVIEAQQPEVSRLALELARDLVLAAMAGEAFDLPAAIQSLRDCAEDKWLGPSTAAIAAAADERRIPMIRLNDGNLIQFGYGARQRRIWTAETTRTSAIAEGISRDKELTRRLLAQCGVPVPQGQLVNSPEEAWTAAQEIGLPIVVKPSDGNHGRGVFTNLTTAAEVAAAWKIAVEEGSGVLVERFITGDEHRVLVVGGKVVAAARGEPAWIIGDGRSSVRCLIETQLNSDPRRGTTEDHPLNRVRIDSAAEMELARQGLSPEAIPTRDQAVLIQRNGNVSIDVTAQVHPEVAAQVCLAARIVGLDIAGVDLVAQDIGRPLAEQGAAIVEVNAGPGLLMHLKPARGEPQPVGRAIIDHLFAADENSRIPIIGVTGGRERTVLAKTLAALLRSDGRCTGLACADGLWIDQRKLSASPALPWSNGQRLLINPEVEAAVIETDHQAILSAGLSYDRCQVGIVIGGHELQREKSIENPTEIDAEAALRILRTQIDVVLPSGAAVLDAEDPIALRMMELCDGEVLLFAKVWETPALVDHLAAGGRAGFVRDGLLVLAQGSSEITLGPCPSAGPDTAVLTAAAAAAWALGISPAQLRSTLLGPQATLFWSEIV